MARKKKRIYEKRKTNIWRQHYYFRNLFKMSNIGNTLLSVFIVWLGLFLMVFLWLVEDVKHRASNIKIPRIEYNEEIKRDVDFIAKGYPLSHMSVYIAQFDRDVAAYLVGIAKKESNWGKRVPVKDGKDCFNYWGYRDPDNTEGSDGHTCFRSRDHAVRIVGSRIKRLMDEYDRETPLEMVMWKCGSSCATHDPESVSKWIADVGYYYGNFMKGKDI